MFEDDGLGTWDHITTIEEPTTGPIFLFAESLAQEGTTIVVGASSLPLAGADDGSVFVYELDLVTQTAAMSEILHPALGGSGQEFGADVDIDGDFIVVGSYMEDSSFAAESGVAYVFRRDAGGSWNLDTVLEDDAAPTGVHLGISVSIRANTVLAGAPWDDWVADENGAVYAFFRSGDTWVPGGPLFGPFHEWDFFGDDVALEPDGMGYFGGATRDDEYGPDAGSVFHADLWYTCDGAMATIVGSPGADPLPGTAGNDVIVGLDGDDVITGLGGNDRICGGGGNDNVWAGSGADEVWGEDGDDTLRGEAGQDVLHGARGVDTIQGGTEGDYVYGGDDGDDLNGDSSNDVVYGDDGDDLIHGSGGRDTLRGGWGVDEIYGDDGGDYIYGGFGDDELFGGIDADHIYGEFGNDDLNGDEGDDVMFGGEGNDWFNGSWGWNTCNGGLGADASINCQVSNGIP